MELDNDRNYNYKLFFTYLILGLVGGRGLDVGMPKYPGPNVRTVNDFGRNDFLVRMSIHLVLFNEPRKTIDKACMIYE